MRFRSKTTALLVIILLVSILLSFIPQTTLKIEDKTGIETKLVGTVVAGLPHVPIVIYGDDDFKTTAEAELWDGDGSESDPYIIENFDFDLGGISGNCINITHTTVYFIIRNCTFTGESVSGEVGIYLYNVTNSEISDCMFYDLYGGMHIRAYNSTITNNEVLSVMSYGMMVSMENSIISKNTIHGGYTGLIFQGPGHCEISNNTITDSSEALMNVQNSDYLTIADNQLINGTLYGLYILLSNNNTIIRNTFSRCGDGIRLYYAQDSSIKDCTLEKNTNGLVFEDFSSSAGMVIEFCEFLDNVERGILNYYGTRNLFRWNVFLNNSYGFALSDGSVNKFDYNYYGYYYGSDVDGDKVGDFPIPIPGTEGCEDQHPLILPPAYPQWSSPPVGQVIELGDEFSYNLEALIQPSPIPIKEWEINNTIHFVIDETGTIRDIDILDVGSYVIEILATNTYALTLEGIFTLTVEDSVSPIWISQIQDKTFSQGEDIEIQFMAWDLAGIDRWEISDSGDFSLISASFGETAILTMIGIENLGVGTYPITVTAYDPSGNYVTATLTVTVSGSETGTAGTEFIISTAGLGVAIVALIVGFYSFLQTRKSS
ncbi:MAG: nitrous oxide reductase family maturation protein NosD [Candidatus Thorarchaeota archaeon]